MMLLALLATATAFAQSSAPPVAGRFMQRPSPAPGTATCADGSTRGADGYCACPGGHHWTADGGLCVYSIPAPGSAACAEGYVADGGGTSRACVWNGTPPPPLYPSQGQVRPRARPPAGSSTCPDGQTTDVSGYCACGRGFTTDPLNDRQCVTQLEQRHFGCAISQRDSAGRCPCSTGFSAVEGGRCVWGSNPRPATADECEPGERLITVDDPTYRLARQAYDLCVASSTVPRPQPPTGSSICADGGDIDPSNGLCGCPADFHPTDSGSQCIADSPCLAPLPITRCVPMPKQDPDVARRGLPPAASPRPDSGPGTSAGGENGVHLK